MSRLSGSRGFAQRLAGKIYRIIQTTDEQEQCIKLSYPQKTKITSFNQLNPKILRNIKYTAAHNNIVSLSSNQIGFIDLNFFVVYQKIKGHSWVDQNYYRNPDEYQTIINPIITKGSNLMEWDLEECPSTPGYYAQIRRYESIIVQYQDEQLKSHKLELNGFPARVYQHECDHLNGELSHSFTKCQGKLFLMEEELHDVQNYRQYQDFQRRLIIMSEENEMPKYMEIMREQQHQEANSLSLSKQRILKDRKNDPQYKFIQKMEQRVAKMNANKGKQSTKKRKQDKITI